MAADSRGETPAKWNWYYDAHRDDPPRDPQAVFYSLGFPIHEMTIEEAK